MESCCTSKSPVRNVSISLEALPLHFIIHIIVGLSRPAVRANKRNNLLATIPKLSKSYHVAFEFKPTTFESGWTNIIHLTTGESCCGEGSRIPAVWFHSSSTTATKNKLHICSAVNGEGNYCTDSAVVVPRGQWTRVEVLQYKEGASYKYLVKVGSTALLSVTNSKPKDFYNVKVFGADDWSKHAQGSMKNLVISPDLAGKCYLELCP